MHELRYINRLLEKAMADNDSERVQELRDQLPRAYNNALDAHPLLQKDIHCEFSRLDRAYFDYCEIYHALPDPYKNQIYTWRKTTSK